jgi:chemotaxis protein histidine kinase CheA
LSTEDKFQAQFAHLQRDFVAQLPNRLLEIQAGFQRWLSNGMAADLATIHRLVHNLSGAGATYGLPELSRVARVLEQALKTLELTKVMPLQADVNVLQQQLSEVAKVIEKLQIDK